MGLLLTISSSQALSIYVHPKKAGLSSAVGVMDSPVP